MYDLDPGKKFSKAKMMTKLSKYRTRAIGYMRSGWIQTLKATGGWAKQKKTFRGVQQKGKRKGSCRIARNAWDTNVVMKSFVGHEKGQVEAAKKYVKPALQKAINKEAQSMAKYTLRKMAEAAKRSGIKNVRVT